MKKSISLFLLFLGSLSALKAQKISWIKSTEGSVWQEQTAQFSTSKSYNQLIEITSSYAQTIYGFGGCFNEVGWKAIQVLRIKDQNAILKDLFAPQVGANLAICRLPIGANDMANDWYSHNESPNDFEMKNFSIKGDMETLVPYIKMAKKYAPTLKLWASPWSPPSWMKTNQHYAGAPYPEKPSISREWGLDFTGLKNGYTASYKGGDGINLFIQKENYFKAYATYFGKFVDEYKRIGLPISMVMPQNEFNSAQVFPSCTWTASGLSKFIPYLGQEMQKRNVRIFFGTVERANHLLVDSVLKDSKAKAYISGAGFQWAGKGAIAKVDSLYPKLDLYQSEQECGNGENTWKYALYAYELMHTYFTGGANVYSYWNIALEKNFRSRWGWSQNSFLTVDMQNKTYSYNPDYYSFKHLSYFVKSGAKRIILKNSPEKVMAFENPDRSIIVTLSNTEETTKSISLFLKGKYINIELEPKSIHSLKIL
ncbi:MAG: glycoside hydrolase family 30 protein [Leadbetterella sp.]